jgi:hypothetical protein
MMISAVILNVDGTVAEIEGWIAPVVVREGAGWVESKIRNVHPLSRCATWPDVGQNPRLGRACAFRIPSL